MDHAQRFVALGYAGQDDAKGHDVVDVLEGQILGSHLLVNAVVFFVAAQHPEGGVDRLHMLADDPHDLLDVIFPLRLAFGHHLANLFVGFGFGVHEGNIFQFMLHPIDPEPRGEGGVDVEGFLGDEPPFAGLVILQGAHVVEPIGQFDQDHAQVVGHGQQHLANALGLARPRVAHHDLAHLGHPRDDVTHLAAEHGFDLFCGGVGVFDDVVEQTGGDAHRVEVHLSQDMGHFQGVGEVGFAGEAQLSGMHLGRIDVGAFHDVQIGLGIGFQDTIENVVDPNHSDGMDER